MDKALLGLLYPVAQTPLRLEEVQKGTNGLVVESWLRGPEGRSCLIRDGIPRFVRTEDSGQRQTENRFAFKWQQLHTHNSAGMQEHFGQVMKG
jgi:hypothetical protein